MFIRIIVSAAFMILSGCMGESRTVPHQDSVRAASDTVETVVQSEEPGGAVGEESSGVKIPKLTPRMITLTDGTTFTLNVPEGFGIAIAAQGLKRVRFMTKSPDGRIFATDMYDKTDNKKGSVYMLDGFDAVQKKFSSVRKYADSMRNPNSCAFYTDPSGKSWLYIALTDALVRYPYKNGDVAPTVSGDTIATFPAYGLSYKYGGWHLTRTVAFSPSGKLYVSVGSSCNACEEKEDVRAAILEMNPDGSAKRFFVRGLRNAVGIKFVGDKLYCTNMGSDHLGDNKPEDQFMQLKDGANYGWPYCYQYRKKIYADPMFDTSSKKVLPRDVPVAEIGFPAHSAPLGLEYFNPDKTRAACLKDYFLVGLHGSTKKSLNHGYVIARVRKGAPSLDFISGFMKGETIYGRPCDILQYDDRSFFFTDDHTGVIYYVYQE